MLLSICANAYKTSLKKIFSLRMLLGIRIEQNVLECVYSLIKQFTVITVHIPMY